MSAARLIVMVAFIGSAGCRDLDRLPPLPPPPAISTFAAADVTGCYQHVASRPFMRHAPPWEPPQKFLLVIDARTTVARENRTVTLWRVRQSNSYRADGYWRVIGDGVMEVTWTDGFEGVRLRLQRGPADELWRGWTEPYSESGVVAPGMRVSLRRVAERDCRFGAR